MKIWVDADACPKALKEILFRAADRRRCSLTLVANQALATPPSPFINSIQVASGFDVADDYIVQQVVAGDLVVTQDIPLAAELIELDVYIINTRGEELTKHNIRQRLNMRDFLETMRSSGEHTGGPAAFSNADKQTFANTLDRLLTKLL